MTTMTSPPNGATAKQTFGRVLKDWRGRRGMSQLALASESEVSQRHLSCLETGRSKPSREMVVHLGGVLDLSLRDRNSMLLAAGFAPAFSELSIDSPELTDVRTAIGTMLDALNPSPAYVIDRLWNVVLLNEAGLTMMAALDAPIIAESSNMAELVLHPDGLRRISDDFHTLAVVTLRRLERELADRPHDVELAELIDRVSAYPGIPDPSAGGVPASNDLVVRLRLRAGDDDLSFITTVASLLSPVDITLEELRLETLLPVDEVTTTWLKNAAS